VSDTPILVLFLADSHEFEQFLIFKKLALFIPRICWCMWLNSWNIIFPRVVYGCQTWSVTLREERRLKVFQNRVLRRIFGAKRDKVTGKWRKLHNEELNDLYCSPNIVRVIKSRRIRWAGHVARMGDKKGEVIQGFRG